MMCRHISARNVRSLWSGLNGTLLMFLDWLSGCVHFNMRPWIMLLLVALSNTVDAAPKRNKYMCPPNFVRHGQSCYFFSTHMATWFDAHFDCKDKNSELAKLEQGWEDRNMRKYLNRPELAPLERWIGGIYNWETKNWVWGANGGQPLKYQAFTRRSRKDDPRWNCIIMDPTMRYKWSSRGCIQERHFICETPLKNLKPPRPNVTRPRKPKTDRPKGKNRQRVKPATHDEKVSYNRERTADRNKMRETNAIHGDRNYLGDRTTHHYRKRPAMNTEDNYKKEKSPTYIEHNHHTDQMLPYGDRAQDRERIAGHNEHSRQRVRSDNHYRTSFHEERNLLTDPGMYLNDWSRYRTSSTTSTSGHKTGLHRH